MKTAVLIILDGLGVGEAPDADAYGDLGTNTLVNMSKVTGGVHIPTLESLAIFHCCWKTNSIDAYTAAVKYQGLEEQQLG